MMATGRTGSDIQWKDYTAMTGLLSFPMPLISMEIVSPDCRVKESGGKAFLATNGDELLNVYKEIDKLERSEIGRIEFRTYQEKYRLFLLPALACALLSLFLWETVFRSIP